MNNITTIDNNDVGITISPNDDLTNFNLSNNISAISDNKYVCYYCNKQINLVYDECCRVCCKCDKFAHKECLAFLINEGYVYNGCCSECCRNIMFDGRIVRTVIKFIIIPVLLLAILLPIIVYFVQK